MKIAIQGTSAAEGWPGLFCTCQACRTAIERGGKDIRTRSGALVDGVLKIDLCPDTYHHVVTQGIDPTLWKYIFITHSHADHIAFDQLSYLAPPFAHRAPEDLKKFYGNEDVLAKAETFMKETSQCELMQVKPFESVIAGEYTVTPVLAQHGTDTTPLNYIIARGGRSLLYACDTGMYDDTTWERLAGHRVDLAVVECTGGPLDNLGATHMGLPGVEQFRARCEQIGLTDRNTRWVLTHFSHKGGACFAELVDLAAPLGFEIAFDGMEIEVLADGGPRGWGSALTIVQ